MSEPQGRWKPQLWKPPLVPREEEKTAGKAANQSQHNQQVKIKLLFSIRGNPGRESVGSFHSVGFVLIFFFYKRAK